MADPLTLAVGASLLLQTGTAFSSANVQRSAGEISAKEAEMQGRVEELGAIQREADRKGRLASAMATRIASAGAKGISAFEGSPLTILEEDIRAEETATERDLFQSRLAALTIRSTGRVKKSLVGPGADIGLVSGLAQIGTQAVQTAGVLGPKKEK